ncbi:hypothetical protein P4O66_002915 [Electrophorus voltai]|uniref:G-protein coupled receptors family 1 profile domain-containing protein n=1 Tax=Electrophorus voltai TaxID=2609070 RepID=A0AAD9DP15_9TELE|nr:hypothetical protein P4O66_002915 [Electrophorus voltai]
MIWALGVISVLNDVLALFFLAEPSFYLSPTICTMEQLPVEPWQQGKGLALNILLSVTVAAILFSTYVAILWQALAASADHLSVQKVLCTMLLHMLQLGLFLMSFLYVHLKFLFGSLPLPVYMQLRFLNFLVILILLHCLSHSSMACTPVFGRYFLHCSGNKLCS